VTQEQAANIPFRELVRRADGMQPWRRVFHAANGIIVVLALQTIPVGRWTALGLLGAAFAVMVLVDWGRLANPRLNHLFFRTFSSLVSPREARKVASSTWYVLGVILALLLFPRQEALAGILVLALADPAAGLVGRRWGRRPFGAGTLEGTAAFVVVAFVAILPFAPWWAALAAAMVAAMVERTPWNVDDNLVIPVTVATVLHLAAL
jgi:dolichol kinase